MRADDTHDPADYRKSHLGKGHAYDASIEGTPFDAYLARWEARHLGDLVPELFPLGIPRYLDFACGTGRIARLVSSYARESVGVDVAQSMLEVARSKCSAVRFECVDLTRDPLALGLFDLITAFRFFGNAEDELRRSALSAINGLLRDRGYLIVNSHSNPQALMSLLHRARGGVITIDLSYFKLRRLLKTHGFEIVGARAIGFWLLRARMLNGKLLRPDAGERLEPFLRSRLFAPFAPNMVLVAQKRRTVSGIS